jgi:integrase/recombinase XerD
MTAFTQLILTSSGPPEPFTDRLRLAVAACLTRFQGTSREHAESGLHCYLSWCPELGLDPLAARRPHLDLYIRSMQEIRRFKPSTVSRRGSVAAAFTAPASWTASSSTHPPSSSAAPRCPPGHPLSGVTDNLQFEVPLTAARKSPNRYDFALVAMLGPLGLRIFEATGTDIADLGEEHGHRSCACAAKAPRSCWSRFR